MAAKQQGTWPKKLFNLTGAMMMIGGGGGSNGTPSPGGGGAGGMILTPACVATLTDLCSSVLSVTIGAGGAGSPAPGSGCSAAGSDTFIGDSAPTAIFTAKGGGRGQAGTSGFPDAPGGSGGGGGEAPPGSAAITGRFFNSSTFLNAPNGRPPMQFLFSTVWFLVMLEVLEADHQLPDRQAGGGGGAGGAGNPYT